MKVWSAVLVVLIFGLLMPSAAFAQDDGEGLDIRGRLAGLIERFVTADEVAEEDAAAVDAAVDSAENTPPPIDPTLVSGIVGGVAIAIAVMLILRGYQTPSKPDPFKTRW